MKTSSNAVPLTVIIIVMLVAVVALLALSASAPVVERSQLVRGVAQVAAEQDMQDENALGMAERHRLFNSCNGC